MAEQRQLRFNSRLEFTPSLDWLRGLDRSFHVLLSTYLRESRTFELYDQIFRATERDACLLPFELPVENSAAVLPELIGVLRTSSYFRSILVSDPYKQTVGSLVDEVTPKAEICGGINMIYKRGSTIIGDNRDGDAFLTGASSAHGFDFKHKRMLFFGCGGVSSAVAVTLSLQLDTVGLADLHHDKISTLAGKLRELDSAINIITFDTAQPRDLASFDLFYNGTGLGKGAKQNQAAAPSPLSPDDRLPQTGTAFDANYTPEKTVFLEQCEQAGLQIFNGLSHMLCSTAIHLALVEELPLSYRSVETIYRGLFPAR